MDVSSLEHVVIRAKLGDIIGFQIIQIAEQTSSFQLIIIALAIEIVPTYRDLERYSSGLGTGTVGSVSNSSGRSFQVRVRAGTEPATNWRSGLSMNLNCPFGYGSTKYSLPV